MIKLNVISLTRFLRERGWPFREALDLARVTRDLASLGNLPPGDVVVIPSTGEGSPVTIREMETAGGVTRVELVQA